MNKRLLLIGVVFIAVLSVVLWFVTRSSTKPPLKEPVTTSLPQPSLPAGIEREETIFYIVPTIREALPSSVPVYSVTPSAPIKERATTIAKLFGFVTPPETVAAPGGNVYIWNNDKGGFIAQENPASIMASLSSVDTGVFLQTPEPEIIQKAITFLSSVGFPPGGVTLSPAIVSYFVPTASELQYVDKSLAKAVEVKFSLKADGYSILTGHPDESFIILRYDASGNLFNIVLPIVPGLTKAGAVSRIITKEEAAAMLISGRGRLVSLYSDADKNQLTDVTAYSFNQATITSVTLALYADPKATALLPVFVFRGLTIERQTGKNIQTTTLLSAGK